MTNFKTKGTQKKAKFKTIYMPDDFEEIWDTFVEMLEGKGGASRQIRSWVAEFVKVHTEPDMSNDEVVVEKEEPISTGEIDGQESEN